MFYEKKIQELGYQLKPVDLTGAQGKIRRGIKAGEFVFISGQLSRWGEKEIKGKLGLDLAIEDGYRAAQFATLSGLQVLKTIIGDLDKVCQFVKVFGMVNSSQDFWDAPLVINGCSDLLLNIFDEKGFHSRSAVGLSVPYNYAVEIEMIVLIKD